MSFGKVIFLAVPKSRNGRPPESAAIQSEDPGDELSVPKTDGLSKFTPLIEKGIVGDTTITFSIIRETFDKSAQLWKLRHPSLSHSPERSGEQPSGQSRRDCFEESSVLESSSLDSRQRTGEVLP